MVISLTHKMDQVRKQLGFSTMVGMHSSLAYYTTEAIRILQLIEGFPPSWEKAFILRVITMQEAL